MKYSMLISVGYGLYNHEKSNPLHPLNMNTDIINEFSQLRDRIFFTLTHYIAFYNGELEIKYCDKKFDFTCCVVAYEISFDHMIIEENLKEFIENIFRASAKKLKKHKVNLKYEIHCKDI